MDSQSKLKSSNDNPESGDLNNRQMPTDTEKLQFSSLLQSTFQKFQRKAGIIIQQMEQFEALNNKFEAEDVSSQTPVETATSRSSDSPDSSLLSTLDMLQQQIAHMLQRVDRISDGRKEIEVLENALFVSQARCTVLIGDLERMNTLEIALETRQVALDNLSARVDDLFSRQNDPVNNKDEPEFSIKVEDKNVDGEEVIIMME